MKQSAWVWVAVIVIAIIGAGWFAFEHYKDKPPAWLISLLTQTDPPPPLPSGDLAPLTTPEGFTATIFARGVTGARVMAQDPKGVMLLSQTSEGKVVALPDLDNDGKADRTVTILENLRQPHGILILCPSTGNESADQDACVLYVAETDALKTYRYDADTYTASYIKTLATFPSGDGHFTRTLLEHPDGKRILISIGSSCNVCDEEHPLRATVQALTIATGNVAPFAAGLRNTVFMATDPVSGEVWGTDNGRDVIGDDIPPDEVNIISRPSAGSVQNPPDFGWPICYGQNIHDTDFDKKQYIRDPCADKTPAHIDLQAHSAALGLAFIPEEGWPEGWGNDLMVAYHGSWNRSTPTGYKVVRFELDSRTRRATGGPVDFLTGFLPNATDTDSAIGRPVGLLIEPGGVVFVSDDRAGAIYRVTWKGE